MRKLFMLSKYFTLHFYVINISISLLIYFMARRTLSTDPDASFFVWMARLKVVGYMLSAMIDFFFYFNRKKTFIRNTGTSYRSLLWLFLGIDVTVFTLLCILISFSL